MKDNIVLICYKYPPEYSGYGKQLKSVLSTLDRIGHDFNFTLLTASKSSTIHDKEDFKVIPLVSNFSNNNSLAFYIFCFKVLIWLILNNKNFSLIHCIKAGPEAVVANIISKIFGKKLIVKIAQDELSSREIKNASFIKKFTRKGRHFLLINVDFFIAISEEIEGNIKKNVSNKTKIIKIPNGVDNKKFHPVNLQLKKQLRKRLKLSTDNIIILFVGAINRRKGIVDLLSSLEYIETTRKCTLVICGPILEEVNLDERIEQINMTHKNINVIYRGVVNKIDEYMKTADVFVLPSYSEGLPNVLLEAASSGLALIATDIGGNRDIVENGLNGYLVPVNSPEILGLKLSMLINNKDMRNAMGYNAKKIIESKFNLEVVSRNYIRLYEELLK